MGLWPFSRGRSPQQVNFEQQQALQDGQVRAQIQGQQLAVAQQQAQMDGKRQLKTQDERYFEKLLNPGVPSERKHLNDKWVLASEAARHLQLTNIYDEKRLFYFEVWVDDLFTVASWDADEYFDERQLQFFAEIAMHKSVSWTGAPRERDALNETRLVSTMKSDRQTRPTETSSFIGGFLAGRR